MKAARLSMLAIPVMLGVAFAQTTGAGGQSQGSKGQSSSGQSSSQSDRQAGSQSGAAGSQSGSQSAAGAAGSQSGSMAGSESGKLPELKTMSYKGTLVDLSCSGGAQGSATAASGSSTTTAASTASQSAGTTAGSATTAASAGKSTTDAANRSTGDASSCPATANSNQLGLKMDDGKTVRFDLVGNQRAQDELKNNKSWTKTLSANKPLKVKISGVMQGDKLIVSSIH
jgi:hypothetical protein